MWVKLLEYEVVVVSSASISMQKSRITSSAVGDLHPLLGLPFYSEFQLDSGTKTYRPSAFRLVAMQWHAMRQSARCTGVGS